MQIELTMMSKSTESCSICDKPIFTKKSGLCLSHYKRQYRYGNPLAGNSPRLPELHDRFLQKIDFGDGVDDCWLWLGSTQSEGRYGELRIDGKNIRAHVYSYQYYHSDYNPVLFVLHKCDVTLCVNPDHLFQGTQADNIHDMIMKGRGK